MKYSKDHLGIDIAVATGCIGTLRAVLKIQDWEQITDESLVLACKYGHVSFERLLEEGLWDIHKVGGAVLCGAVRFCSCEMMSPLLDNGADVEAGAGEVMSEAIRLRNIPIMKLLAQHGALIAEKHLRDLEHVLLFNNYVSLRDY